MSCFLLLGGSKLHDYRTLLFLCSEVSHFVLESKPNVKCFIELTNKLFSNEIGLMKDQNGWQSFIRSIEVRNKLMHPKEPKEFEVTDEQVADIKSAFKWFIDSVHSSILFGFVNRCELKVV